MHVTRGRAHHIGWKTSRPNRSVRMTDFNSWQDPVTSDPQYSGWERPSEPDSGIDPSESHDTKSISWQAESVVDAIASWSSPLLVIQPGAQGEISPVLRRDFHHLVNQWKQETTFVSSSTVRWLNNSYLGIIGLGPPAIPLILTEMREGGLHWGAALAAITRENPAAEADSLTEATDAWLHWAERQGHTFA